MVRRFRTIFRSFGQVFEIEVWLRPFKGGRRGGRGMGHRAILLLLL